MRFEDCVKDRRSIRKFKQKKLERETLEKVVSLASFSPSWKNTQVVRYIAVEDRALIEKIASECVQDFEFNARPIRGCAALVIATIITGRSGFERDGSFSTGKEDRWEVFDAGIATQTFCLAAHSEGLGTVILGIFDEQRVHELAFVPSEQKVAALICVGYPDEEPAAPRRKTVQELLTYR